MSFEQLFSSPNGVLVFGVLAVVIGLIFVVISNAYSKSIGDDLASQLERTNRYREQGFFENLDSFDSDSRNQPIALKLGGCFLIFVGIIGIIVSIVWFVIRTIQ